MNTLSGEIPPELENLAQLTHLYLRFNTLSGAIPAELGNLANLEYLYLHDNTLSGAIPAGVGELGKPPDSEPLRQHPERGDSDGVGGLGKRLRVLGDLTLPSTTTP